MRSRGKGLLLRMLRPLSILRLWTQETVGESFQLYHLEKVDLMVMKISVSLDSFQAVCCYTNRTSLRSWDCAVSLVLTAPRPASVESPSSWMAAPGTSAVRTVRASTCCGTAR